MTGGHLLDVRNLFVEFDTRDGVAKVINGVSYHVDAGETLAVLGESGSGKYWISFYPGIALLLTIMSINLVGDRLRDVLNPRLDR